MKITPASYSCAPQNNNKPAFKAQITGEVLSGFAKDLSEILAFGQTDRFLEILNGLNVSFREIKFKGETVNIKVSEPKDSFLSSKFTVTANRVKGPGEGKKSFYISTVFTPGGERVAKKFRNAAKRATIKIVENADYLNSRSEEVANNISA